MSHSPITKGTQYKHTTLGSECVVIGHAPFKGTKSLRDDELVSFEHFEATLQTQAPIPPGTPLVFYRDLSDDRIWCQPETEFSGSNQSINI